MKGDANMMSDGINQNFGPDNYHDIEGNKYKWATRFRSLRFDICSSNIYVRSFSVR